MNLYGLDRLNQARILRPVLRSLVNIANGLQENNNTLIDNRFVYYTNLAEKLLDEFKNNSEALHKLQVIDDITKINLTFLNQNNERYYESRIENQMISLYMNGISQLISTARENGLDTLKSTNEFLNVKYSKMKATSAT